MIFAIQTVESFCCVLISGSRGSVNESRIFDLLRRLQWRFCDGGDRHRQSYIIRSWKFFESTNQSKNGTHL